MKTKETYPMCAITLKAEIERGNMGQLEYRLHKDKTWCAYPFTDVDDMRIKQAELKKDGYKIEKILIFQSALNAIGKPPLSVIVENLCREKGVSRIKMTTTEFTTLLGQAMVIKYGSN